MEPSSAKIFYECAFSRTSTYLRVGVWGPAPNAAGFGSAPDAVSLRPAPNAVRLWVSRGFERGLDGLGEFFGVEALERVVGAVGAGGRADGGRVWRGEAFGELGEGMTTDRVRRAQSAAERRRIRNR